MLKNFPLRGHRAGGSVGPDRPSPTRALFTVEEILMHFFGARVIHILKPTCPSVHVRVGTCQSRGVCVCECTCACTLAHLCTLACHATRRRGRPFYHRCRPSLAATYDLRPRPSSRGPQRLSRHSPPPGRTSPAPTWAPSTPGRAR